MAGQNRWAWPRARNSGAGSWDKERSTLDNPAGQREREKGTAAVGNSRMKGALGEGGEGSCAAGG